MSFCVYEMLFSLLVRVLLTAFLGVTSCSLCGVNEICALLGFYAMQIGRGQLKCDVSRAETKSRLSRETDQSI